MGQEADGIGGRVDPGDAGDHLRHHVDPADLHSDEQARGCHCHKPEAVVNGGREAGGR